MISRDIEYVIPVTNASSSGVTVITHVYIPASLIPNGSILTAAAYGGVDIGLLITVIRFPSPVRLVPFLFQVPSTVTGVFTVLSREMLQVKVRPKPLKKPSSNGEPVITAASGRGRTVKTNCNNNAVCTLLYTDYQHILCTTTVVVFVPETTVLGIERTAVQV